MPGPPPKPVALKLAAGNPGKRKINNFPKFSSSSGVPRPPKWLDPTARDHWKKYAPHLHSRGLLADAYLAAFEMMCDSYSEYRAATLELQELAKAACKKDAGSYTTKGGSVVSRPELIRKNKASKEYRAWCAEFGMTPSAAGTISVPSNTGKSLEELLA